ncbi:hypothetical protein E4T91_03900 [Ligilactobacillus murinus]|nr:hypothetical protein [Ligilactobacillus murinus]MBF0831680.1 hypothetical protein [Ligilactobacillus murinus]TFU64970.1 hypothetical protein E4T91_03900 [Ligilactobacillus murinus]
MRTFFALIFLISIFCCVHYLKVDQQQKRPKICIAIAILSLILCGSFSNAHNTSNVASDTDSSLVADSDPADANAQGTIVGNSRSMIYHVPGQRGYRMNSSNAVYFNTEAEAQAAGYRKAYR